MATRYPIVEVCDASGQHITGDAANLTLTVVTDLVGVAYAGSITEVADGCYLLEVEQEGDLQSVSGSTSTPGGIVVKACLDNQAAVAANVDNLVRRPNPMLVSSEVLASPAPTLTTFACDGTNFVGPFNCRGASCVWTSGQNWNSICGVASVDAATGIVTLAQALPTEPEAGDRFEIHSGFAGAVGGGDTGGAGAVALVLTVVDGDGSPVDSYSVTLEGVTRATDGSGEVTFYRAVGGTYQAICPDTPAFIGDAFDIVVDGEGNITSPAGGVLSVTRLALPAAVSAEVCVLWEDVVGLDGALVGAREGRLVVVERTAPDFVAAGHLARDRDDAEDGWTDSSGRATLTLVRGLECIVQVQSPEGEREYEVTVPEEGTARLKDYV